MRIPTYNETVNLQAMPAARIQGNNISATAADFGAGTFRDLQQFGAATQNLGEYITVEANKAIARDASTQYERAVSEYMAGLANKKGKDALAAYDEAEKELGKIRQKVITKFNLPGQERLFNLATDGITANSLQRALNHQIAETQRYKDETLDAENMNKLSAGATAALEGDADTWAMAHNTIVDNTREKYRHLGAEVVKAREKEATTLFHAKVAEALSADSSSRAMDYLKENSEGIDKAAYAKMKKHYEERSKQEKERERENELRAKAIEMAGMEGTDSEIRAKVNDKFKDSKEAEFVWSIIKAESSIREKQLRDEQTQKMDSAYEAASGIIQSGGKVEDALAEIPVYVPFEQKENMRNWILKKYEAISKGQRSFETDWAVYEELSQMATNNPAKFAGLNMLDYRTKLSDEDYKHFTSMRNTVAGKAKSDPQYESVISPVSYVNNYVRANFGGADKNENQLKEANRFRLLFETELNKYPVEDRNKTATFEKVVDYLNEPMSVEGDWWGTQPRWKVIGTDSKYQAKKKPKGIPESAQFFPGQTYTDKVTGKKYTDLYIDTDSTNGMQYLYSSDGAIIASRRLLKGTTE